MSPRRLERFLAFVSPGQKGRPPQLYLRTDCLNWLLAYAADELFRQGVVPTTPTAPQSRVANCIDVADLHMEWDFSAHAWEATFVAGPFAGTTKRFSPRSLDRAHWTQLQPMQATGDFSSASRPHKKSVAKEFLLQWCTAVERDECAAFESRWGELLAISLESPMKSRRLCFDPPAVADDDCAVAPDDTAVADDDAAVADDDE